MNFLLVLAAAIVEFNIVSVAALRSNRWIDDWAVWLSRMYGARAWWTGWRGAFLLLAGPLLVTLAVFQLLFGIASALGYAASLGFLLLMLGPYDLNRDVERYRRWLDDPDGADEAPAFAGLATGVPLGPVTGDERFDETRAEIAGLALAADRAWFEPLFWFFVLGPCGALAYRLCERSSAAVPPADPEETAAVAALETMRRALADAREALEWLPGRITALAMGVAGTLVPVLELARSGGLHAFGRTPELVARSALAATDNGRIHAVIAGDPHAYRVNQMLALVRRTLNVWLVLFAAIALASGW